MSDLDKFTRLAEAAARRAGGILKDRDASLLSVDSDAGHDLKLAADRVAETAIRETLQEATDFPILGEELGFSGEDLEIGFQWIVDPLDGTANYRKENPACCVSIALWQGLKPILGIIYNFNSGEMLSGSVDDGTACLNGAAIRTSTVKESSKAIYATGFPLAMNLSSDSIAQFIHRVQSYKKIRMIGSAALSLAYVACGRFDIYEEESIRLWDVAAGIALVRAAGGRTSVCFTDPDQFVCNVKAAANDSLLG